jgi:hypothetical protein
MDVQAERCAHCGTPSIDGGRYCTNCGAELGTEPTNPRFFPSAGDTAERVYDLRPPAYAVAPSAPPPPPAPETARGAGVPTAPSHLAPGRTPHGPGPGLWIGAVATMLVVLVVGGFLLLHGGDAGGPGASKTPPIIPKKLGTGSSASTGPASPSTASSPSSPGSSSASTQVKGPPTNVAGFAEAQSPSHAPAGVDFAGRPVTYVAANMVDGRNDTCWRTAGDATGTVLTFRLDQPTRISRVGLVNGYSKIAYSGQKPFDWYRGNRRVLSVQWVFDDGSSITQRLGSDRAVQQIPVKPVTTSVVRLKITSVSPPGKGRAARDDTAISEVLLLGRSA